MKIFFHVIPGLWQFQQEPSFQQNDDKICPLFVTGTRPVSHRVGRSVRRSVSPSVRPSHFAFFALLGSLRVGKFVFEHAPAQIITAPAQIIIAPAQIVTAPAQQPATGAVVYTIRPCFIADLLILIGGKRSLYTPWLD